MYVDNNFRYDDFSWKGNKLYLKRKNLNFSLIQHPVPNDHLFWIKYPNGEKSGDYYNLTHAKDNCIKTVLSYLNSNCPEDLQEAPGCVKTSSPLPK